MSLYSKKKTKKDAPVITPLTPPSMEANDLDPALVLFNQPLSVAARRSDQTWGAIPSPVLLTVDWLNKKGLNEEGLYRVPGKATTFATYKALFDRGIDFNFFELHEMAPENVAMVLIKYLQALPEPIYSAKYEAHFKLACAIPNDQERASVLRGIMYMIPLAHRETLRVLVDHLRLVSNNSSVNKMTTRNIELSWGLSVGQLTGAVVRVLCESPLPVPSTLQFSLPFDTAVMNAPRSTNEQPLPSVPFAVTKCIQFLQEHSAATHPNLFTTDPSNPAMIDDIVYVLNGGSLNLGTSSPNSGPSPAQTSIFPSDTSVIDIATTLKLWISSLPSDAGLFPEAMKPEFEKQISAIPTPIKWPTLPEKLEALIWKLPDPNLETIKTIISFLSEWITAAPEDMTAMQAIEIVFPSLSQPLQQVLAFMLYHKDSLFNADSDLTAHLQNLVYGNSPGMINGSGGHFGGFSSPNLVTSPRHAITKALSSGPASPIPAPSFHEASPIPATTSANEGSVPSTPEGTPKKKLKSSGSSTKRKKKDDGTPADPNSPSKRTKTPTKERKIRIKHSKSNSTDASADAEISTPTKGRPRSKTEEPNEEPNVENSEESSEEMTSELTSPASERSKKSKVKKSSSKKRKADEASDITEGIVEGESINQSVRAAIGGPLKAQVSSISSSSAEDVSSPVAAPVAAPVSSSTQDVASPKVAEPVTVPEEKPAEKVQSAESKESTGTTNTEAGNQATSAPAVSSIKLPKIGRSGRSTPDGTIKDGTIKILGLSIEINTDSDSEESEEEPVATTNGESSRKKKRKSSKKDSTSLATDETASNDSSSSGREKKRRSSTKPKDKSNDGANSELQTDESSSPKRTKSKNTETDSIDSSSSSSKKSRIKVTKPTDTQLEAQ